MGSGNQMGQGTTSPTSAPTIVNPPQQKDPQNRKGGTPEHLQESAAGTLVCLHKAPFPTSGNVTNQIYINEKRIRKNQMSEEHVSNKGKRHNPKRRTTSGGDKQSL